jgi:hypothetical protein
MSTADRATPGASDLAAAPAAWATLWAQAFGQAAETSLLAWSAMAKLQRQAGESYVAMLQTAIESDEVGALAAASGVDVLLQDELRLAETAAERLAHFGEATLSEAAAGPVFSLPE